MAGVVPNEAELNLLDTLTGVWGDLAEVALFKSDITPGATTTLAALEAAEADFQGYARIAATNWTAAATVGGKATTAADQVTFTKGAGGTGNSIYGWFIVDQLGALISAGRATSPPVDMSTDGAVYKVTPQYELLQEP